MNEPQILIIPQLIRNGICGWLPRCKHFLKF
jgi:hypothetical protein